jgi:HEAT repeat protein
VPELTKSLSDPDSRVVRSAVYALGKIGPKAAAAEPELKTLFKTEDRPLRIATVWALLQIEPQNKKIASIAVPLLTEALDNAETDLARYEAARALGNLGPAAKSAVPALKKLSQDGSDSLRAAAEEALQQIQQ